MTYVDGSTLKVRDNIDIENCRYWVIVRPENKGDDRFDFVKADEEFKKQIRIKEEFIKVVCYSKNGYIMRFILTRMFYITHLYFYRFKHLWTNYVSFITILCKCSVLIICILCNNIFII